MKKIVKFAMTAMIMLSPVEPFNPSSSRLPFQCYAQTIQSPNHDYVLRNTISSKLEKYHYLKKTFSDVSLMFDKEHQKVIINRFYSETGKSYDGNCSEQTAQFLDDVRGMFPEYDFCLAQGSDPVYFTENNHRFILVFPKGQSPVGVVKGTDIDTLIQNSNILLIDVSLHKIMDAKSSMYNISTIYPVNTIISQKTTNESVKVPSRRIPIHMINGIVISWSLEKINNKYVSDYSLTFPDGSNEVVNASYYKLADLINNDSILKNKIDNIESFINGINK